MLVRARYPMSLQNLTDPVHGVCEMACISQAKQYQSLIISMRSKVYTVAITNPRLVTSSILSAGKMSLAVPIFFLLNRNRVQEQKSPHSKLEHMISGGSLRKLHLALR